MISSHFVLWQLLLSVFCVLADETKSVTPIQPEETEKSSEGFGYELIQTKLDHLEYRFSEVFVELKEQGELFLNNQRRIEGEQRDLNEIVNRHERKIVNLVEGLEDAFGANVSLIKDQSRQILELQTICSNHDLVRKALQNVRPKNVSDSQKPVKVGIPLCSEEAGRHAGVCRMMIANEEVTVNMERHRFGGDWLVVLRRFDGSENFNRNWSDYSDGFGTVGREFWLGLERLHQLTKETAYEVVIEMEDFEGNYRYARYSGFSVGSEEKLYPLGKLHSFSGTAGDSFTSHGGKEFSAIDKGPNEKCATSYNGGWWYYDYAGCFKTHLTGNWKNENSWESINWMKFGSPDKLALKFVQMSIKKM